MMTTEEKIQKVHEYTGLTEDQTKRFVGCLLAVGLEIVESQRIAELESQQAADREELWVTMRALENKILGGGTAPVDLVQKLVNAAIDNARQESKPAAAEGGR